MRISRKAARRHPQHGRGRRNASFVLILSLSKDEDVARRQRGDKGLRGP